MDIWVEEIEGWESRPFSGGYAGLHDLADAEFSGAVSAGSTWALFVNGRVVAVTRYKQTAAGAEFADGDVERFADADGTVYEAPHPSVPLLVAMQLAEGETRGRYYTQQTPVEEVDGTLTEGGFTGYIELSENVLSGDYYTVYQAGRSMDLAFVGNARRLRTGEDARDAARDEVGIYEVVAADIDVIEIPEADDAASTAGAGIGGAAAGATTGDAPTATDPDETHEEEDDDGAAVEAAEDAAAAAAATDDESSEVVEEPPAAEGTPAAKGATDDIAEAESSPEPKPDSDPTEETDAGADDSAADGTEPNTSPDTDSDDEPTDASEPDDPVGAVASVSVEEEPPSGEELAGREADERAATSAVSNAPDTPPADAEPSPAGAAASATEQLASRSVPSLDPERTEEGDGSAAAAVGGRRDRPGSRRDHEPSPEPDPEPRESGGADPEELAEVREELAGVRESLAAAEGERDEAREELARVEEELERVRDDRDDLEAERDELRAETERLRARVRELEAELGGGGDGPSLTEAEALAGTNLFVRYESKGKTTVEDARDGSGSPEDLRANLRITSHTRFETEGASVDGRPFDEWLHATQRYRFAEWLVAQFVFEVRDTGNADRMADLYDVLPDIDRIELDGSIAVPDDEDGEVELGFDVVCRDRMGEPLVAANLDASREPVGENQMADLVRDAVAVCRAETTFAGAFYLTAAFYESPALETARDATSGSLLSRDSRLSYVKESRNRGFHLALVESRDDAFHLSVPDL